ncbi:MAG: flavodoxin-dependent (E)-4-hydroxy-3-methylbut-2-enyl-diphosphate synthase [Candidatus Omnitrophota bacterium]|nr:flavodoxin-dependent (E)-4-hydroxy-3-methylbut-2-enyl-diphosphate synthase [Candidatus Omnitrophota bacterium]
MGIKRRKTRIVKIGTCLIGGSHRIAIQSMAKVRTADISKVLGQIKELEEVGCQIVRLAVKDDVDAAALKEIKKKSCLPLVADIHFNWRLAIKAIESGVDKIRLNPGNIYRKEEVANIARAAAAAGIPIRVGANSGSLRLRGASQADAMVKSVMDYVRMLEKNKFYNIVLSLKASNIMDTVAAYRRVAKLCDYPLHLGVTATGAPYLGTIKSSIALGILLAEGIGDTIRVSLTDEPQQEIAAAASILESLGLRKSGPQIISCPTCGRCEVDLIKIVKELEKKISTSHVLRPTPYDPLSIAVMGCVVNGPGEAKEADIGVAFGKKDGLLFKKGKPVRKVDFSSCVEVLLDQMRRL